MSKLAKFFEEIFAQLTAGSSGEILTSTVVLSLFFAVVLNVYIFFFYRFSNKTGFYSKNFNKTLAGMGVITCGIVLAMQTNVFISLGMVGALSIIRFRNVVKDPFDLLFLFWAISTGIICGTQLYKIAFVLAAVVSVVLLLLELVMLPKAPALLIVNSADASVESALLALVGRYSKKSRVKSRTLQSGGLDIIVEVRAANEAGLLAECGELPGVTSVTLLAHDGELRG